MNVRSAIADTLTEALPGYLIRGYPFEPDQVTRPTVMLWQSLIQRMPQLTLDRLIVTVELWVLVGSEDPAKADDALDAAIADVIEALHPIGWLNWETAERGVLLERFNGYRITAQAVAKIGD